MIIDGTLLAKFDFMTDFNGISRQYPKAPYPAGIYDEDKPQYKYGKESIEYPNLTLPEALYDSAGNSIQAGFYTVMLSPARHYLDLYQSGELKARVKVIKLTEEMITNDELKKEAEIKKKIEKAKEKQKLKKQKKAEEELKAFKETQAANTYAVIEDSNAGYYILKYSCFNKKAEGIIQK